MIKISLLEDNDIIQEGQWCRPLSLLPTFSDGFEDTNTYSGRAINNFKWLPIEYVLGKCWLGKTLIEYNKRTTCPLEVATGDIPESHRHPIGDYIKT